jgi:hypothetical protein
MKNKREAPNPNRNPFAKATKKTKKNPPQREQENTASNACKGLLAFPFVPLHSIPPWICPMELAHPVTL